ncbi:MAG TPA: PepSY-associated TM helix domain-containing protein [Pyrinomonadaceae bacterium]|jgi:uncharacterized iron-regulated membrane protein
MRKLIFKAHMYVGLCVGLLLALMGLTGSMLVFGDELDVFLNPSLLSVEPRGERVSIEDVLKSVRQAYPSEKVARIRFPHEREGTYELCFEAKTDARCVYVDPYSAAVLGSRVPARSFKGRLVSLHRRLLSGATGETIIGVGGILLLLLSLSGALLWWPGRRNLARGWTIRWKNSRYRVNYDLHRIVGICAMLFLSFSAVTGAAMVFRPSLERALNRLASAPPPKPKPTSTVVEGQRAPLDEIIRNADAALPQGELTMINLPATRAATVVVRKRVEGELHPHGRSLVYLDQYSGQVLLAENALEAPPVARTFGNLFPLHVGRLGGILTRLLQVFVGFVPAILFCTGLLMWRSRVRARKLSKKSQPVYSQSEALS